MTRNVQMVVRWVLAGATFVTVVAMSAGCSMLQSNSATPVAKAGPAHAAPAASPVKPVVQQHVAVATRPPANSFGEFGTDARGHGLGAAGANIQQHTYSTEGRDTDVCVDPSGKWLLFASTRHSDHSDIYLQRVDGTSVIQLTDDAADDAFPTFSPDGKSIAFCSTRSGNWDIYTMDLDGRNVIQVTNGVGQDLHPSFSPDGKQLVYSSLGTRSDQWELWTVNLDSNQKRMIGYGLFPSWSPDREVNRIAFQRARQRGSRWFSLWTLDLRDGEACRVTEVAASGQAAIVSPVWSPDGKQLAFASVVDPGTGTGTETGSRDIWVVQADGGKRRKLTDGGAANLQPFWAVDNRVYFVSDRSGNDAIWSVSAGGLRETHAAAAEAGDEAAFAAPAPKPQAKARPARVEAPVAAAPAGHGEAPVPAAAAAPETQSESANAPAEAVPTPATASPAHGEPKAGSQTADTHDIGGSH